MPLYRLVRGTVREPTPERFLQEPCRGRFAESWKLKQALQGLVKAQCRQYLFRRDVETAMWGRRISAGGCNEYSHIGTLRARPKDRRYLEHWENLQFAGESETDLGLPRLLNM